MKAIKVPRSFWLILIWLVSFSAAAHIEAVAPTRPAKHQNQMDLGIRPHQSLKDLVTASRSRGVKILLDGVSSDDPVLGKAAGIDTLSAIKRALTGYSFVVFHGEGGKDDVVKVTGRAGSGKDNDLPVYTGELALIPNKAAFRPFTISKADLEPLHIGDTFEIPLPEGTITATVKRKTLGSLGSAVMVAKSGPIPGQNAILSYGKDGSVYGRIQTLNGNYRIQDDEKRGVVIYDLDEAGVEVSREHDHFYPDDMPFSSGNEQTLLTQDIPQGLKSVAYLKLDKGKSQARFMEKKKKKNKKKKNSHDSDKNIV